MFTYDEQCQNSERFHVTKTAKSIKLPLFDVNYEPFALSNLCFGAKSQRFSFRKKSQISTEISLNGYQSNMQIEKVYLT